MRNLSKRRQGLCLLLAGLVLLCLLPGSAQANSAHNPYWKDVVLSDTRDVASIAVYVDDPSGAFRLFKTFESEHAKDQKIYFERPEKTARFYIEVTMTDGAVRASEPVDATGYDQDYKYNVKANTLKEKTSYLGVLYLPLILLSLLGTLALPLGFTVLVEFLTALPFKLKPYKHVILINLITNLAMNVLIYALFLGGVSTVWITPLLEVVAVVVEYSYYKRKYQDQSKKKLLLYTILANALSWGLYELALLKAIHF